MRTTDLEDGRVAFRLFGVGSRLPSAVLPVERDGFYHGGSLFSCERLLSASVPRFVQCLYIGALPQHRTYSSIMHVHEKGAKVCNNKEFFRDTRGVVYIL